MQDQRYLPIETVAFALRHCCAEQRPLGMLVANEGMNLKTTGAKLGVTD